MNSNQRETGAADGRPDETEDSKMIHSSLNMGRLKPEGIAEYRKAHDEIDPDFVRAFRKAGFATISCFLQGSDLAVYSEVSEGFEKEKKELARNPAGIAFGKRMIPLVAEGAQSIVFKEVFHTPDPLEGNRNGLEKRLFSKAVLRKEAIPAYIQIHDEISPVLLDAFREAGIIKISCFLHENIVMVYTARDEAIYSAHVDTLQKNPQLIQLMAEVNPMVDPAFPSVVFEEVFRLP